MDRPRLLGQLLALRLQPSVGVPELGLKLRRFLAKRRAKRVAQPFGSAA
jgi:hypothetical protein